MNGENQKIIDKILAMSEKEYADGWSADLEMQLMLSIEEGARMAAIEYIHEELGYDGVINSPDICVVYMGELQSDNGPTNDVGTFECNLLDGITDIVRKLRGEPR